MYICIYDLPNPCTVYIYISLLGYFGTTHDHCLDQKLRRVDRRLPASNHQTYETGFCT